MSTNTLQVLIDTNIACQTATISPPVVPISISYSIYSTALSVDMTATSTQSALACGAITYTIIDTNTALAPDATVFTVVSITLLQIYTVDNLKHGMSYSI